MGDELRVPLSMCLLPKEARGIPGSLLLPMEAVPTCHPTVLFGPVRLLPLESGEALGGFAPLGLQVETLQWGRE